MKNLIKSLFARMGYEIRGTRYTPTVLRNPDRMRFLQFDDAVSRRVLDAGPELAFVQVGAFDGQLQDPLRKYITKFGWLGVMIEPQPVQARKLVDLYRDNDRITVLQAALDSAPGTRPFFAVNSDQVAWAGALASFHKDVILKHRDMIPGLEAMIEEVKVECVTFDKVLELLPGGRLDLLQIDTEGADAYILSLFPFDRIKPAIVHWEVRHLSIQEREDCLNRLAGFGYRFAPSGDQDMLAVLF